MNSIDQNIPKFYYKKDTSDRRTFVTWNRPFSYTFSHHGVHDTIEVPANYRFDLSSVPRIFWPILAPFELGDIAPLIHDFIYNDAPPELFTRKEADEIYLQLMLEENIPERRAKIAFWALKLGSWISWKKPGTIGDKIHKTKQRIVSFVNKNPPKTLPKTLIRFQQNNSPSLYYYNQTKVSGANSPIGQ